MSVSVTRILRTQGRDVVLTRISADAPVYNAATGTYTTPSPVSGTLRGVMIDFAAEEIDGTRILDQDRKLLLDATSGAAVPALGDIVDGNVNGPNVIGGFKVERVRAIAPKGTPTAYVCQVRG